MIHEIAHITVQAGKEAEFEAGVAKAAPLFQRARGCRSFALQREIEAPARYRLVVGWDTVDDHMVHFRKSDDFQGWRQLVAHCFDGPPQVVHVSTPLSVF